MKKAQFSSMGNDLSWKYFDDQDGLIYWFGYDDSYWWEIVAKTDQSRQRIGPETGRIFEIDFETDIVNIKEIN